MIDLLYPIANLKDKRLEIFIKSLKSVNKKLFNICVSDTGKKPSLKNSLIDRYTFYPNEGDFNKSKTINIGIKELISTDTFIVCDADIIFLMRDELLTCPSNKYFLGKPNILVDLQDEWLVEHSLGAGKCFITNKMTFNKIGGFDENYIGYGYEDIDFAASYYLLTKSPYSFIDALCIHLHHSKTNSDIIYENSSSLITNKKYFFNKFSKYNDFLESIYSRIRERKHDTNSRSLRYRGL